MGREGKGSEVTEQPHHVVTHSQVDSEEPVFEAVINWVKHAREGREESLPDLLQYVRMPLLTPRYITDVIDAEVSHTGPRAVGVSCSFVS